MALCLVLFLDGSNIMDVAIWTRMQCGYYNLGWYLALGETWH